MAQLILTIPAADLTRTVNALATRYGYLSLLADGSPNPQTKQEFARLQIVRWVKQEVRAHELGTAQAAVVVPVDVDVT